jgi:hypothetical protein
LISASVAERANARDVFALHELAPGRLVNLDGHGRGSGWAGNVTVEATAEPLLARARTEGLARQQHAIPARVFGPYWAAVAAAVAVGDYVVVFGGDAVSEDDRLLRNLAEEVAVEVSEVPAAKRLADELEVTQAALGVATVGGRSIEEVGRGIATRAAQALSCEFGAVLLYGPPLRLFLAEEGWRPSATEDEILAALIPLRQVASEAALVEQDMSCSTFPFRPLAFEDGLVARLVAPLGEAGSLGLLVVAHVAAAPRGFTSLCQQVATTMAAAAAPVIDRVLAGAPR